MAHEHFSESNATGLLVKQFIDFIFDGKPLNSNLEKYVEIDYDARLYNVPKNEPGGMSYNINNRKLAKYKSTVSQIDDNILFSKDEKIFRLCFINYFGCKYLRYTNDDNLTNFLTWDYVLEQGWETIPLKEIRDHCASPDNARFWQG